METWQLCNIVRAYARTTVRTMHPFVIVEMYIMANGVVMTIDTDRETAVWYDRQAYKPIEVLEEGVIVAHPGVHGVCDLACNEQNRFERARLLVVQRNGKQVSWFNKPENTS